MKEEKKVLPIGKDDFRLIRESKKTNYYIDKTLMIKDFIDYDNLVTLITRPRRFGKTLNMTMLRDFFDVEQESREIFDGLAIMETEYADLINTVPVISLSLKGSSGSSVGKIEASIAEEVFKEYKKHARYLANVDKTDDAYLRFFQTLEMFRNMPEKKGEDSTVLVDHIQNNLVYLENSLAYLMEALYTFYKIRPMVLIDEYDDPIIEAHRKGFREDFTDFYASFLTKALKGNPHLGQALLTGIQRVAKESIFSKINNIAVYNVLSERYASYFGLTTIETQTLLEYNDLELNNEVKSYYDGYNFAGIDIYNPWSILNYAQDKNLKSYWLFTSTNALIHEVVKSTDDEFHENFEKLVKDGKVTVRINLEASFAELPETETLWGLFVNAGYLTVTHADYRFKKFTVRIPNEEIKSEFEKLVSTYTKLPVGRLQDMLIALIDGEMDEFLKIYKRLVLESTSYHDTRENAYHMLMLGMVMHLRELYDITSNIEAGHGRSDLIMKSKDAKRSHIIIEFKQGEDVEKLKYEALAQIEEKKYYAGLTGDVLCVGVSHDKKRCELVHQLITV